MISLTILSLAVVALVAPITAQDDEYTVRRPSKIYSSLEDDAVYEKPVTPVPILKQINNHNDDGSYTFGFEAADGSFKIETKEANGQVRGKYGYTDADGKLHVVEYGANKFGFQPSGEGITVPPVNYDAEPEEEFEEPEQRITQYKPRKPQPAVQQAYRQPQEIIATRAPSVPQPHIIYSAPVPKRPAFFAGGQPQQDAFNYDVPAPQPRPSPKPAPRPQPVQYTQPKAIQYTQPQPIQFAQQQPKAVQYAQSQPKAIQYAQPQPKPAQYAPTEASVANFIPSAQFSQAIQYEQPQYRPVSKASEYQSIEQPQTFFRPEPVSRPKAQPARYTQTEAIIREEPNQYVPRKPKANTGGFFDQLKEQFALPQGNAQHDVSFGFF